jgi:hypothetical protein
MVEDESAQDFSHPLIRLQDSARFVVAQPADRPALFFAKMFRPFLQPENRRSGLDELLSLFVGNRQVLPPGLKAGFYPSPLNTNMNDTLADLMTKFGVAETIASEQIDTIQTERLRVERLTITLKDGSERHFYRPGTKRAYPILVNGAPIRRKSCWHRKPTKSTTAPVTNLIRSLRAHRTLRLDLRANSFCQEFRELCGPGDQRRAT